MSGWDFESSNGGSKVEFTKFAPGITRIRVIDAEPHARWTHWLPQHKRSVNCPGKGCPICEIRKQQKANKETPTYAMGRRFAINIDNLDTGKVEVCEQGKTFFEDLRDVMTDLSGDGKTLKDAVLKVRRRGTDKDDTSYRIDVEEVTPLTNIELEALNAKKTKLEEYFKPHTPEQIMRLINGEKWEDVMKFEQDEAEGDDEEVVIR